MTFDQFLNKKEISLDIQLSKKSKEAIENYVEERIRKTFHDIFIES